MKKKILICGATGFIGRNLTEQMSRNEEFEVHAVRFMRPAYDYPNVIWHHADLRKPEDIERVMKGMDVLIQAAATTSGSKDIVARPYIHVTDNAVMNSLLFRAAFEHKVKHVVFFSCTVMYQSNPKALTESDFDANVIPNCMSKKCVNSMPVFLKPSSPPSVIPIFMVHTINLIWNAAMCLARPSLR
jgi:GDP-L-fucose synthase